ncbi:MAG: Hsp20/alpha crystallin family protein, partial [Opitutaceae bacterium]
AYAVPAYDIKEADEAYGLEVIVPGVARDAVELNVEQGELVITARRRWKAPEGWSGLFRETADANYRLRLDLNDVVDVEKINAELEQGILRVTLPKAEAVKPRKIAIA